MIHNVQETGRRMKLRLSSRLRVHFLALARRVVLWRQSVPVEGGVCIGVTSVEDKSGRSIVAINLAASLAKITHGNVLYIDTGFGKTGILRRIPRPAYGLSEILTGSQSATDCVCNTNIEGLFVLGAGKANEAGAVDLPIEALASVNTELNNTFDYVVFDLPLADEVTHCFSIAQHLEGVILVNTSGALHQDLIHRAVRRFRSLSRPVIGLVLNKA